MMERSDRVGWGEVEESIPNQPINQGQDIFIMLSLMYISGYGFIMHYPQKYLYPKRLKGCMKEGRRKEGRAAKTGVGWFGIFCGWFWGVSMDPRDTQLRYRLLAHVKHSLSCFKQKKKVISGRRFCHYKYLLNYTSR